VSTHDPAFDINPGAVQALSSGFGSLATPAYTLSSDVMNILLNKGLDVSAVFETIDNIALSLTNTMRNIDSSDSNQVQGEIYIPTTYINVNWPWLILPLSMWPLALLYLLLTRAQNRRSSIPSWRISALATMEHGFSTVTIEDSTATRLDMHATRTANGKETAGELEEWADEIDVKLQRRGKDYSKVKLNI
jgi:hypothetical protein